MKLIKALRQMKSELKCRKGYCNEMVELIPSVTVMYNPRCINLSWLGWFVEVERR